MTSQSHIHLNQSGLSNCSVFVTRPSLQAGNLTRLIEDAGGLAIKFPLVEILPGDAGTKSNPLKNSARHWDWLIFVSTNAVHNALNIHGWTKSLDNTKVAAIGAATRKALESAGIRVDLVPANEANSEGLLATNELRNVEGLNILIIRGVGGLELLARELEKRGAHIEYAEVYRRITPPPPPEIIAFWREKGINCIVITSNTALERLMEVMFENELDCRNETLMIVIGKRLEQLAVQQGWKHIAIARDASDQALLDAMTQHIKMNSSENLVPGGF